jgi:hypothetical protein
MDHRGRRSLRLPDYDYSQADIYFITICTHKKRIHLAHIIEDRIRFNQSRSYHTVHLGISPQAFPDYPNGLICRDAKSHPWNHHNY